MKGFAKLTLIGGIFFTLTLVFPPQARAQSVGAFYWGDADGNGDIGAPDVSALSTILNNVGADDTLYYTKYPVSRYRQDLDGNGDIGAPDLSILGRGWPAISVPSAAALRQPWCWKPPPPCF